MEEKISSLLQGEIIPNGSRLECWTQILYVYVLRRWIIPDVHQVLLSYIEHRNMVSVRGFVEAI